MAMLAPAAAISTCETALREIMAHAYSRRYGPDWLDRISSPEQRQEWSRGAEDERRKRGTKGVLTVPDSGLAYSHFYELVEIASNHWEPLSAALGKQKDAIALLARLERLRDTVAHGRALVPFEEDLASGIAGQIRNQVTIFMSSQDPAGDIYPRIESIADSFGRRVESAAVEGEIAGAIRDYDVVLHPGEVVTFICAGTDPKGRDLDWTLRPMHRAGPVQVGPSGIPTSLQWTVTDDDVTETAHVEICLSTHDAPYHRFNHFDHRAYFAYRVRPPVS